MENLIKQRNKLGRHYETQGRWKLAIELYEKNIAIDVDTILPYHRLAIVYKKQHMFSDEIRVLKLAVKTFKNGIEKETTKTPTLESLQLRLEKAIENYDKHINSESCQTVKGLQYIRNLYFMPIEELSNLINVSENTINQWENGIITISNSKLKQLVKLFNISEKYFKRELDLKDQIEIQKEKIENDIKLLNN